MLDLGDCQKWRYTDLARAQVVHRKQGTRTDQLVYDVNKLPRGGNGAAYLLRRLARDHKDILARYERGEFKSVRAAARAAGLIKDQTPRQIILKLIPKLSADGHVLILSARLRSLGTAWRGLLGGLGRGDVGLVDVSAAGQISPLVKNRGWPAGAFGFADQAAHRDFSNPQPLVFGGGCAEVLGADGVALSAPSVAADDPRSAACLGCISLKRFHAP